MTCYCFPSQTFYLNQNVLFPKGVTLIAVSRKHCGFVSPKAYFVVSISATLMFLKYRHICFSKAGDAVSQSQTSVFTSKTEVIVSKGRRFVSRIPMTSIVTSQKSTFQREDGVISKTHVFVYQCQASPFMVIKARCHCFPKTDVIFS